jgi:hypothetical protein
MSQVKFHATTNQDVLVEVMAGWDRPLKEFYMTLFFAGQEADDPDSDEALWSTIGECGLEDYPDTKRIREKLAQFGITAPEGFWDRVELQEANVIHTFKDNAWTKLEF